MKSSPTSQNRGSGIGRVASPRVPADAAEAAIVDLEQGLPLGMGPLEQVLAARILDAVERLLECARQLEDDELMIVGSAGQQRAHPLLKMQQDLHREISDGPKELSFQAEHRAMCEQMRGRQMARRADRGGNRT
jgi:hypothetical protein